MEYNPLLAQAPSLNTIAESVPFGTIVCPHCHHSYPNILLKVRQWKYKAKVWYRYIHKEVV